MGHLVHYLWRIGGRGGGGGVLRVECWFVGGEEGHDIGKERVSCGAGIHVGSRGYGFGVGKGKKGREPVCPLPKHYKFGKSCVGLMRVTTVSTTSKCILSSSCSNHDFVRILYLNYKI